jgi:hypothetical protein
LIFIPLVSKFKQQSKISETNTEGLVGLELMKTDLEHAGYGLPWCFPYNTITYGEAVTAAPANTLNDAPGNPPRALAAINNITFNANVNANVNIIKVVTNSDYLTIKSALVSGTDAAQKWSYIVAQNAPAPKTWGPPAGTWGTSDPLVGDNVIVINPMPSQTCSNNCLVMNGGTVFATVNQGYTLWPAKNPPINFAVGTAFTPPGTGTLLQTYLIYDIAPAAGTVGTDLTGPLTMPFNRADYFVGIPRTPPTRCAIGTGVLYKAILNQDGTFHSGDTTPLLDCVADMQVIFGLDMNGDGIIDTYSDAAGVNAGDATNITGQGLGQGPQAQSVLASQSNLSPYRSSVVEIRIYILAHEGQQDPGFTFPAAMNPINVGSLWAGDIPPAYGRQVHLDQLGDVNWMHYRWKVYTMVVKLQNIQ